MNQSAFFDSKPNQELNIYSFIKSRDNNIFTSFFIFYITLLPTKTLLVL